MFDLGIPLSFLVALGAILLPCLRSLVARRAAAKVALVLSVTATVLFVVGEMSYKAGSDVRIDLVIIPPLLFVAWMVCLGFSLAAPKDDEDDVAPAGSFSRILAMVILVLLVLLALLLFL